MPNTLPLSGSWDVQLDNAGNLNLTDPYTSIAQDVASAIRTFLGECWYDVSLGVPYFQTIFGHRPPASLVRAKVKAAALQVNGVSTANVTAIAIKNRAITGTIVVTSPTSTQPITVTF